MPTWTELSPVHAPSARHDIGMDWDSANNQVVLFNGAPFPLADTWLWDGTDWTQASPAHSPSSAGFTRGCIAWDGTRIIFVYAGGLETWGWDGTDWTDLLAATDPANRADPSIAWTGSYVLMFGGQGSIVYDETWKWDGTNWTLLSPVDKPAASRIGCLASDGAGETIYFGPRLGGSGPSDQATYRWDEGTVNWVEQSPSVSPPARSYAQFSYGGPDNGLVLFGGYAGSGIYYDDTWIWRDSDWCQCSPDASPDARDLGAISYTPDGTLLFGGETSGSGNNFDTWLLTGICCPEQPPPTLVSASISHVFGAN